MTVPQTEERRTVTHTNWLAFLKSTGKSNFHHLTVDEM